MRRREPSENKPILIGKQVQFLPVIPREESTQIICPPPSSPQPAESDPLPKATVSEETDINAELHWIGQHCALEEKEDWVARSTGGSALIQCTVRVSAAVTLDTAGLLTPLTLLPAPAPVYSCLI
ncbi:uncharacterized protein EDB91DRAFT_1245113 [Suillus paluster]|uniref:uncharacterized protein n=1 Tax=Suillus paluster TaxID=48578 RepID=UPI001B864478|nr:uncharacterized protein EDB91DRAFT_1245113 [Suillus paluster]KAG1748412.1 hypothetical protein EDB91DRAFT_1245113 [Suillus paluster]